MKYRRIHGQPTAGILSSAILALALSMPALSANAETLTLLCQNNHKGQGGSFTLRVDYDNKRITLLHNDGSVHLSGQATVTENSVHWGNWSSGDNFRGELNRLSGEAWYMPPGSGVSDNLMRGPCRRATQKF